MLIVKANKNNNGIRLKTIVKEQELEQQKQEIVEGQILKDRCT